MFKSFAPLVTQGSGTTPVTIQEGKPIKVYGFILSKTSGSSTFTFDDADGNEIFTVNFIGNVLSSSICCEIPWLADKGLIVTSNNANSNFSIFHTHEGT